MKKIKKLKICDWILLILTLCILISGVYLEAIGGRVELWIWIHIFIGILFFTLIYYHIFLHFGKTNWFSKFSKLKNQFTRILWWIGIITLLTGIIATAHWVTTTVHSPIGGVHGKIGFLMIILCAFHLFKRIKFLH